MTGHHPLIMKEGVNHKERLNKRMNKGLTISLYVLISYISIVYKVLQDVKGLYFTSF